MEAIYLILGLLIGFFARDVRDKVVSIYELLKDKFDAHQAGVVKPQVSRVTKGRVVNLESKSGIIPRLTPQEAALKRARERDERIRNGS